MLKAESISSTGSQAGSRYRRRQDNNNARDSNTSNNGDVADDESDSDTHNIYRRRYTKQHTSQSSSDGNGKISLSCLSCMSACYDLHWLQAWNMEWNMSKQASDFFAESQNTFNLLQAQFKKRCRSGSSNSNEIGDGSHSSEVAPYLLIHWDVLMLRQSHY